jgi:hypothetical protein
MAATLDDPDPLDFGADFRGRFLHRVTPEAFFAAPYLGSLERQQRQQRRDPQGRPIWNAGQQQSDWERET